jgi:hypothetical protein
MRKQKDVLVGARAPIELPPLTQDQREYLEKMLESSGKFDPDIKVGGPNLALADRQY